MKKNIIPFLSIFCRTVAFLFLTITLFYSCSKTMKTFYYGMSTQEKIMISQVPGKIIIKVDPSKTEKALDKIRSFGTIQDRYQNVYIINTGSEEKKKAAFDMLNKEEWIRSKNPLYMTADSQIVGITDEIVFALKDKNNELKSNIIKKYSLEEIPYTRKGERGYVLATVKKGESALSTANKLMESGEVKFAHPNFYTKFKLLQAIPNDEFFGQQFYLHNTGQTLLNESHVCTADADIDSPEAWKVTRGSSAITIAVIDEGTERNNPDLPAARLNILNGSNFVPGQNANDPSPSGDGAHGTCCSGIVAAEQNNHEGVSGVAPLCHIMPVKVPFGGLGTTSDFADAINFAWQNGADVLSNSWGGGASAAVITNAISDAITLGRGGTGAVVVFAAGNTADHVHGNNGYVAFPGNAAIANLITVGASNRNDRQANYSPTSADVDLVAPSHHAYSSQITGETFEVWSTDIIGDAGYNQTHNTDGGSLPVVGSHLPASGANFADYTGRMGGTSAATPEVAGVCALILSIHPTFTPAQVRQRIMNCCDKIGNYAYVAGRCNEVGSGRVNARNAVTSHLWMKDTPTDNGTEPNAISSCFYISEDIWARTTNDGGTTHQNPVYRNPSTPGAVPNAVYVKVRNAGCEDGGGTLKLYWAKASTGLSWPAPWDGSVTSPALMGSLMGSRAISVPANSEATFEFDWFPPNPADYSSFGDDQTHFCLLARIERTAASPFGMEFPETANLGQNVSNNNNIIWKNITVENLLGSSIKAGMLVANYSKVKKTYKVKFEIPRLRETEEIANLAEIKITMTEPLLRKWKSEEIKGEGYKLQDNALILTSPRAWIGTLTLNPKEIHGITMQARLKSKPIKNTKGYISLYVSQWEVGKEKETEVGGILFQLHPNRINDEK